jgi:hypothetical protein
MINKIFFDLHVQFPDETSIRYITSPLFARFYTKYHSIPDSDDITTFDSDDEIWLSCDYDLNINITKFCISNHNRIMRMNEDYPLEEYSGDNQFVKIRNACESEDRIDAKIYKWVLKKIKTFYNETFGKRIDETIQIMPKVLLNLILNYLI